MVGWISILYRCIFGQGGEKLKLVVGLVLEHSMQP